MANILLGASGAVNAVNLPHYVCELSRRGHVVRVILTTSAESFISPAALRASTGVDVLTDRDFLPELTAHHVALAHWGEILAVAPLTANTLAKLALGIADNLLLATALTKPPAVVAPCMNIATYQHPVVQGHLDALRHWGATLLAPTLFSITQETKGLRMAGPRQLGQAIEDYLAGRTGDRQESDPITDTL